MADSASLPIRHSTYFKLARDMGSTARAAYASACRAYLSSSPGMLSFSVGLRVEDIRREVSDLDFDVAMHQVFRDKAAFEAYNGADPRHEQFVEEVDRWAPGTTRRVLDSYVSDLRFVGQVGSSASAAGALQHSLYFKLVDGSGPSIRKLEDVCRELLSGHEGEALFALGVCANPLGRPVNVENFDVALDMEWVDRDAYERYEASERHKRFGPMTQGTIQALHVFDSQTS